MIRVDKKALSVNQCWQGKRFKTSEYKQYEQDLLFLLPKFKVGLPPYKLTFIFGFSNSLSDFDNPVKPLTDILQKKYSFNDRDIVEAHIFKVKVDKGNEYFKFEIISLIT